MLQRKWHAQQSSKYVRLTHSSEICGRIISLESNVAPLVGDTGRQRLVRLQQRPQLMHKQCSKNTHINSG